MAPPRRKRLRGAAQAPAVEARGPAADDLGTQERRELSGPAAVPEGNDPIPDNPGASSPSEGTFEDDLRDEVQKMLEGLGAEIKQALLTKRKKFEMDTKASIKTASETIEHIWKTQQEQRQNLHLKYSQQFLTLFREWNIDMRKAQEQEEKLASMFQEQRKVLHQARVVQKQRLQKIKNLHTQFLKSMQDLEKDHEHRLTDEQSEVREEMIKLQNKIMMEVQQQELATVQTSLQFLLS